MNPESLGALVLLVLPALSLAAPDGAFDGGSRARIEAEQPQAPAAKGRSLNAERRLWITAQAGDAVARSAVANAGVSIEEVVPGQVAGFGTPKAAERLRKLGVRFTAIPLEERFHIEDFPPKDSIYHNHSEMEAEIKAIAASAPGLASVFSIGKGSQGKREIWALRLNASESGIQKSAKPGIVFMGTHHAREHLSTEVPLLLAKYLVDNREKPEIASLLASRDIHIIPMVNPDGVEYDIEGGRYHMHRKNMRDNGDGSTGVDLNRNYGFHWGEGGASTDPDSDIYRGPMAFSEPETRAVKAFVEERKNISILLSYHTFSELILYPWGHKYDPIEDGKALAAYKAMAGTMAQMTGYTPQQSSQLYIASGDTTDWAWGALRIFSFTFELTPKSIWSGGFYPGAAAVQTTFQNNIRPALYLIGLADDPFRAASAGPLAAQAVQKAVPGGR